MVWSFPSTDTPTFPQALETSRRSPKKLSSAADLPPAPSAASSEAAVHRLIDTQLQSAPGHHDELRTLAGQPREAWQRFFGALGCQPLDELARRKKQLDRQILENGVTFNAYTEPGSVARPWQLDLLPVIIEH